MHFVRCSPAVFDAVKGGDGRIANVSPFMRHRDKVGAMARENSEQSLGLGMVRFIFYVAIAIAVGYAIVRFWPAYYWPH